MKHGLLIICILMLGFTSLAQENRIDQQGRKQGVWVKIDKNGKKIYEGTFLDDRPVGIWKRYHDNGNKKAELNYTHDTCVAKLYTEEGALLASGKYIKQKKEGEWSQFLADQLISKAQYHHNLLEGVSEIYQNGVLIERTQWKENKQNGLSISYAADGVKTEELNFQNNLPDGVVTYYHPNGKVRLQGHYRQGLREGEWMRYSAKGVVIERQTYVNGKSLQYDENLEKENKRLDLLMKQKGRFAEPNPDF